VLQLSPAFTDANLIVGTHDYVMASLPWAVKTAAAVIGFTVTASEESKSFALPSTASARPVSMPRFSGPFLRREGHTEEALRLVRDLLHQFPRNVIFAMQEETCYAQLTATKKH